MKTISHIALYLLSSIAVMSCVSTHGPSFIAEGDMVDWDLELTSNCQWPYPGPETWDLLQWEHGRAKIRLHDKYSKVYTPRAMNEATRPASPGCSEYDPPWWWTDEMYIREELEDLIELINEKTNMSHFHQRIRFLVFTTRYENNKNVALGDAIESGAHILFRIDGLNAIRNMGVVFVDDVHRFYCRNGMTETWLKQELIHIALHEMGHVSTDENDQTAHNYHSGDWHECCSLKSPLQDNCRKSPGLCQHHIQVIANRRENHENR